MTMISLRNFDYTIEGTNLGRERSSVTDNPGAETRRELTRIPAQLMYMAKSKALQSKYQGLPSRWSFVQSAGLCLYTLTVQEMRRVVKKKKETSWRIRPTRKI